MYTREQAEQVLKDYHNSGIVAFEKFLDAKFPKFKNGIWLKHKSGAIIYRTVETTGYGIGRSGNWEVDDDSYTFVEYSETWQPATNEEVIEALEKYAKSIGLVEGARVKCLHDGSIHEILPAYILNSGDLWCVDESDNGCLVMHNGEWATPIKSDLHDKLDELKKQAESEGMKLIITFENK